MLRKCFRLLTKASSTSVPPTATGTASSGSLLVHTVSKESKAKFLGRADAAKSSGPSGSASSSSSPPPIASLRDILGPRAIAAGLGRPGASNASLAHSRPSSRSDVQNFVPPNSQLYNASRDKYLVIGDGLMAPFMALCLRVHGLDCDLAHAPSSLSVDRGTIVLTPSMTQLLGDVLNVSVPSGSVIGRILTFDYVGNDMCDIDLNEFRERGEGPTYYCCDRLKVEAALLSLCRVGAHSCHICPVQLGGSTNFATGAGASPSGTVLLEALPDGGVRVRFPGSGLAKDYLGVICTSRSPALVPELTLTEQELRQHAENAEKYREQLAKAPRWMELCVPPLPELKPYEKRFTPGSQEIVEIITPREAKLTVRPTLLATKLFYHVTMTIPESAADPTLKTTSMKQFWDETARHWTAGVPGYISHTLFRPLFTHMQQHFSKSSALVYKTPLYLLPYWCEGEGRLIKVAHAAHGAAFDGIDIGDAQGFTDCFRLARTLSECTSAGGAFGGLGAAGGGGEEVKAFLQQRYLEVMEELDHHARLLRYGLSERGAIKFMSARFGMRIMKRYKKSWSSLLRPHVSLLPRKARE